MGQLVKNLMTHENLVEITRREVQAYAEYDGLSADFYSLHDDSQKRYAVVAVPHFPRPWASRVVVMAQVVGEKVIIIEDRTDKPLYEVLMVNAHVPREQIVLV